MSTSELRKLSIELYASDENDLVKMAGLFSGLKRFVRRLYTKIFNQERYKFEESNDELRGVITELYDTFKSLDASIDSYDMDAYKGSLDALKANIATLTGLLAKMKGDTAIVEKVVRNEATPIIERERAKASPQAQKELRDETLYRKYLTEKNKSRELYGKKINEVDAFQKLINQNEIHISDGIFPHIFAWLKNNSVVVNDVSQLAAAIQQGIYTGTIMTAGSKANTYDGNLSMGISTQISLPFALPPTEVSWSFSVRYDPNGQKLNVTAFKAAPSTLKSRQTEITAQSRPPMAKLGVKNLGQGFYPALVAMCKRVQMNPEDLLCVMWTESMGLDATAGNPHGGAAGLIQFMPDTLQGVGYKEGSEEFRKLSGEQQIPYIERYIRSQMGINGGPFTSAAQYYLANFWPVALKRPDVRAKDMSAVIIDKDKQPKIYNVNQGLDVDHDGKITLGDFYALTERTKKTSGFQKAVAQLRASENFTPSEQQTDVSPAPSDGNIAILKQIGIDGDFMQKLIQEIPLAASAKGLIEVFGKDKVDSAEFIRVLKYAMRSELGIRTETLVHDGGLQLSYDLAHENAGKIETLAHDVSSDFVKAAKLNTPIRFYINAGRQPSAELLTYKKAQQLSRMFRVKYIMGR